jgi:hypothetical protein
MRLLAGVAAFVNVRRFLGLAFPYRRVRRAMPFETATPRRAGRVCVHASARTRRFANPTPRITVHPSTRVSIPGGKQVESWPFPFT